MYLYIMQKRAWVIVQPPNRNIQLYLIFEVPQYI